MDINKYLNKFIQDYQHFDVEAFIDVEAEDVSSFYLAKVEEENEEEENKLEQEANYEIIQQEENAEEDNIETISSVMEREKQLIILGNPGTGKSTILVHEALKMANAYLQGMSNNIPVFVSLKHLMSIGDLEENLQIVKNICTEKPIQAERISTLFLDGLNELNHQIYQQAINSIKQFLTDYPEVKVVITSRKYGYKNQLGIPQYEVQVFDEEDISNYIKKRTGNILMLIELRKNEMLLSLCSTPLILKMVVDTWLATGHLPLKLSSLYREFVDNQLRKSLKANNQEMQTLLHVMSILAFELRNTGFISDSAEQVNHIIEYYIEESDIKECDAERICDMLMKSGLVLIYDRGNGFEYVSFLHETFQEYLCSLYISDYYKKRHSFPVDITNKEWKEAVRLALEVIIPNLSSHELIALLKLMQKSFIAINYDVIDQYLTRYIELLDSNIEQYPIIFKWLEQYVLFNMSNYMVLSPKRRTPQRFSVIIKSIFGLRSKKLYKLLFTDLNGWMNEWLYADLELYSPISNNDNLQRNIVETKANIARHAAKHAKDKALLYQFIKYAEKENTMFFPVTYRLQRLEGKLIESIYSIEAKRIYAQNNSLFFLLLTKDQEMISKEVEKKGYNFEELPSKERQIILHKYSDTSNNNLLGFYYCYIFPKYQDLKLLDKHLLISNLTTCPSLIDKLVASPFWLRHLEELAQIVYRLPEAFWSDGYKAAINNLLSQKISQYNSEMEAVLKEANQEVGEEEKKKNSNKEAVTHKLRNLGMMGDEYTYVFEEKTSRKKLRKWFDGISQSLLSGDFTPVAMLKVSLAYLSPEELDQEVIPVSQRGDWDDFLQKHTLISQEKEGNEDVYYFLVKDLREKENVRKYQLKDGVYYKRITNSYKGYILSKKLVDEIDIPEGVCNPSTLVPQKDYALIAKRWYYLMPKSELLPRIYDGVNNMSVEKLIAKGWIDFVPKAFKRKMSTSYKFYLVIRMEGEKAYAIEVNGQKPKKIPRSDYDFYEVGDILVEYRGEFWKMDPSTIGSEYKFYGFKTGTITRMDGKWAWIHDSDSEREYICHATEEMKIDQTIMFWPTAISSYAVPGCLEAFTTPHT